MSVTPRKRHEFHEGERSVQERAGVVALARRLEKSVLPFVPLGASEFLASLPFAILGASDERGAVWASIVSGAPGLLRLQDENTLEIAARLPAGDPLERAFHEPRSSGDRASRPSPLMGVLAIELATRSRVRLNGRATSTNDSIVVKVDEFYGNCQQYIHPREIVGHVAAPAAPVARTGALTSEQRAWIARADTFFVASRHPTRGADASHRGGDAGFVTTPDDATIVFPDYPGNNMFNTLGNLATDPGVGLLFVDFEQGRTLQISGRAEIVWSGVERQVRVHVERVVENPVGTTLRWQ